MPRLYDQHLHSRHSFDCETEPAANVRAAIEGGLAGLTFTEHFDTHPDEWPGCRYDDAAYSRTIAKLRNEFGNRIFVGKGIEICYQPERMEFIVEFLSQHEFDVVLLSIHWADGKPVWRKEQWDGVQPSEGTRRYLRTVVQAVQQCADLRSAGGRPVFDILGHLDFVKRYTHRFFGEVCTQEHMDLVSQIFKCCIEADLIPEINTSTLRQGLNESMPGSSVLQAYAEVGGTAVSLGSDAHRAADIGAGFQNALESCRSAGIRRTVHFVAREPTPISIEPS